MKHVHSFYGAAIALALVACAGVSNNSFNAGNSNPSGAVRIVATLVQASTATPYPPIDQTGPGGCPLTFKYIDPTQIETGDTWQFQLVSVDANNNVTPLAATGWISTDSADIYGNLSYDQGVLTTNAQTRAPETVSVVYNGITYRQQYDILAHRARIRGQLVAHDTNKPIAGVEIDFYGPNSVNDSSIVFRGKVVTQTDGTFLGSVPAQLQVGTDGGGNPIYFTPTQFFQINDASIPAGFQRFYSYNSAVFQTGLITCLAPIEVPGTATPLPPVVGNNDLISISQCSGSNPQITPQDGWILLYSNSETTPTATGCTG